MSQTLLLLLTSLLVVLPCCKEDKTETKTTEAAAATSEPALEPEPLAEPEEMPTSTQLITADFSAPIPAGYKILPTEKLTAISAQIGEQVDGVLTKPRAASDHFVSSIVFTRVKSADVDPKTACEETADAIAKAAGAKAQPPKEVEFSFGKTCQFEMGDEKQQAIQTVVFVDKKFWTLTCNFDLRDEASPKECNEVLSGFSAIK